MLSLPSVACVHLHLHSWYPLSLLGKGTPCNLYGAVCHLLDVLRSIYSYTALLCALGRLDTQDMCKKPAFC